MIRLIALDLDNTLLEADTLEIAPEPLALLRLCAARGIAPTIATGRIFNSAVKYAAQIGPESKIVCYNGALVADPDGSPLYTNYLSVETMRAIVDFCKPRGLYCQFYEDHRILVEEVTDEGTRIDPDLVNTTALEVGDFGAYEFKPSPKAMIVEHDPTLIDGVQADLAEALGDDVYIARSQTFLIEIMPAGVNKALSLARLGDLLGIDASEVMACGDQTNDAEMVKWAGIGVAVGNAVDALKNVADYVCEGERGAGVAEAIRRFCL